MSLPDNATTSEKLTVERNLSEATRSYNDACRRNDQAVGTIMTKIEPSEYSGLEKKSAKEVWDVLKARHADTHTGVAAFFTKVGMLQKKYTDGDDMNMHLTFFTLENRKLGNNAFDDEFLAQLILMSLPQDNINWNMVTIVLLQSTSCPHPTPRNSKPLTLPLASCRRLRCNILALIRQYGQSVDA